LLAGPVVAYEAQRLLKPIGHGLHLRCLEAPAGKVCDTSSLGC
jgi:hypothetical protein